MRTPYVFTCEKKTNLNQDMAQRTSRNKSNDNGVARWSKYSFIIFIIFRLFVR
jgi:hypothetical protein